MRGPLRSAVLVAVVAALAAGAPATAQQGGGQCLTADPPEPTVAPQGLHFGITSRIAGSAGALQGGAAPEDLDKAADALVALRPPQRELVLRLNRLFWADGEKGIAEFGALVDHYAARGLRSEVQVRYHPPEGAEGDIDAWEQFVRRAVRELGARRAVVGFSITNEANFPVSPNTSDGAYKGVVDALVRGVAVARDEGRRIGRPDLVIGFNVAWRWEPGSDARFWQDIGAKATPAFREALDYVGVQVYPGLVWPPVIRPGQTAGDEIAEALTLVRDCHMPMAGLGREVDLWVSENGYPTNLGRTEAGQAEALDSTVRAVHRWSGTLGITDYRYFNLRDNESSGEDLFDAVGLLRDDYSPKPAFAGYRGLIGLFGAEVAEPTAAAVARARPTVRMRVTPRRDTSPPWRFAVRGRVVRPAGSAVPCGGRVRIRLIAGSPVGSRLAEVGRSCRFAATFAVADATRFAGRRKATFRARFAGTRRLAAAAARPVRVRVRGRFPFDRKVVRQRQYVAAWSQKYPTSGRRVRPTATRSRVCSQ